MKGNYHSISNQSPSTHFLIDFLLDFGILVLYGPKKYPNPFLGLRPQPNSVVARPRPHASLGPTWASDLYQSTSPLASWPIPGQPFPEKWGHCLASQFLGCSTNSWEYRCQAHLLKWEPFPKPLSPKSPLTINDIEPFIALIAKVIIIIPQLIGYKQERKRRQ